MSSNGMDGRIMVIVRDELASSQLKDVILHGITYVMEHRFRWFVTQQSNEIKRKYLASMRRSSSPTKKQSYQPYKQKQGTNTATSSSSTRVITKQQMLSNSGSNPVNSRSNSKNIVKVMNQVEQELLMVTSNSGNVSANSSKKRNFDGDDDDEDQEYEEDGGNDEGKNRLEVADRSLLNNILLDNQNEVNQLEKEQQQQLEYGFTAEELKTLPVEYQLILIQEKILKLIPPVSSNQNKKNYENSSNTKSSESSSPTRKRTYEYVIATDSSSHRNNDNDNGEKTISSSSTTTRRYYVDDKTSSTSSSTFFTNKKQRTHENVTSEENNQSNVALTCSFLDPNLFISVVTHHQLKENLCLLDSFNPKYVILYDSDVQVVRKLESYQSTVEGNDEERRMKLYFFNYGNCLHLFPFVFFLSMFSSFSFRYLLEESTEEHRYVGFLNKEKKSFESLISLKSHLVISLPDNISDLLKEKQQDLLDSSDSRTINSYQRQQSLKLLHRKIIIDIREFRSSLPFLLYSQSFHLLPKTLIVGDYILSPEIAIERKGIQDLHQSFNSGRLYTQMEQMAKYYKFPILLIEFSQEKPFCLLTPTEIPTEIQLNSVISKLVLLIQSFPNLRILWSRSAQQTSEIFRLLMINHEEVDVEKAVSVGNLAMVSSKENATAGSTNAENEKEFYRYSAQEILLSLPGINSQNYRALLASPKINCLSDLSGMKEKEMAGFLGPVNAKKLYSFFHQEK
jgi:ERCC4-type nuclease